MGASSEKEKHESAWDPDEDEQVDIEVVYSEGYLAFQEGKSDKACPFSDEEPEMQKAWLFGWHDASEDEDD